LNAGFDAAATPVAITVSGSTGAPIVFTADTAVASSTANIVVTTGAVGGPVVAANFYTAGALTKTNTAAQTVDELVTSINANTSLTGKVKASNDGGKLNIQNLSTEDLTIVGATSAGVINGDTGASNTTTVGGNTVRKNLITQFNDLRTQLDKLADDSSFNGVNLLRGDTLKLVFNEINTSSISIVSQNANGINSSVLSIGSATAAEFSSNTTLDTRLDALSTALTSLRSQATAFGSNLSIVQNRQEFTKAMITTLQTGSDALVLADGNEEAANLLALQTRQQLSTTALSLASQADQAVLRLF
jgi:flagellin